LPWQTWRRRSAVFFPDAQQRHDVAGCRFKRDPGAFILIFHSVNPMHQFDEAKLPFQKIQKSEGFSESLPKSGKSIRSV
jgi:hypothetical protein